MVFKKLCKCCKKKGQKKKPTIELPESTGSCLIIPYRGDLERWDKSNYDPSKTKGIISTDEFRDFFFELDRMTYKSFSAYTTYKTFIKRFFWGSGILFVIGCLLLIIGLAVKPSTYTGSLPSTAKLGFSIMGVLIFFCTIYAVCFLSPTYERRKFEYIIHVEKFLEEQNKSYKGKGIEWRPGKELQWLEVHLSQEP